jgi:hypothetical protein
MRREDGASAGELNEFVKWWLRHNTVIRETDKKDAMNFNKNKYYIADDNRLTELEKLQLAKDLLELERQGLLRYRDGVWELAAGVEIEETSDGPAARFGNKEEGSN